MFFQGLLGADVIGKSTVDTSFASWASTQNVKSKAYLHRDPSTGIRGLYAGVPIRKGAPLFHVPQSLLLTKAAAAEEICKLVPDAADLPEWSAIAAALVELRSIRDPSDARLQRWAPYIGALPTGPGATGSVLEWPQSDISLFCQTSSHGAKAELILEAFRQSEEQLRPILEAALGKGGGGAGAEEEDLIRWSFSMLLSRLVRLESLSGAQALVPWADMVNHSSDADCFIDLNTRGGTVEVAADRDYSPGQEVFISYGHKSSAEMLVSYGFAPLEDGINPHESLEITLSLSPTDPNLALKTAVLAKAGMQPASQAFPLRMQARPRGCLGYAALAAGSPTSEAEAMGLLFENNLTPEVKSASLRSLLSAVKAASRGGTVDDARAAVQEARARLAAAESAASGGSQGRATAVPAAAQRARGPEGEEAAGAGAGAARAARRGKGGKGSGDASGGSGGKARGRTSDRGRDQEDEEGTLSIDSLRRRVVFAEVQLAEAKVAGRAEFLLASELKACT